MAKEVIFIDTETISEEELLEEYESYEQNDEGVSG